MQLAAIIVLTFRELWAKKIVIGLFVISTLVWVMLAFALNLDIVEGSLAGLRIFGQEPLERESLPARGIDLARFRIGDIWIILVQPTRDDSPVMDFLDEHGEGFFHIAYQVDDVEAKAQSLSDAGIQLAGGTRHGVEGWKLQDLDMAATLGVMTQLVEPDDG